MDMMKDVTFFGAAGGYVSPECKPLEFLAGGVHCTSESTDASGHINDWEDGITFNF